MSITAHFLDELRDRVTLSEIVGRKVLLKRAGREFSGLCPFHHEKSPSFTVNDQKGFYHCFGCGAHGDAVRFLTDHDNMHFLDAVRMLCDEAGIQMPKFKPEDAEKADLSKIYYEIMEKTSLFFETQLQGSQGKKALLYCEKRGLNQSVRETYRLGYAPQKARMLYEYLRGFDYEQKHLIDLGLIKISERDGEPFSFFRDRLIFPVKNRQGKIVAFGGRLLEGEGPKYINSPETPIFHKGHLFYGVDRANASLVKGDKLIICEGYLDVIALNRAGFMGAMAPLGTALTEEQIDLVWKMSKSDQSGRTPILCFDGDTAGQRAALRAVDRMLPKLKAGCSADIVFLPAGEDPDSLYQNQGAQALRSVFHQARNLVDVLWESLVSSVPLKTPEDKSRFQKMIEDKCEQIQDQPTKKNYKSDLMSRLFALFKQKKLKKDDSAYGSTGLMFHAGYRKQAPFKNPNKAREAILFLMILDSIDEPEIHAYVERLSALQFSTEDLEEIRLRFLDVFDDHTYIGKEAFFKNQLATLLEDSEIHDAVRKNAPFLLDKSAIQKREEDILSLFEAMY